MYVSELQEGMLLFPNPLHELQVWEESAWRTWDSYGAALVGKGMGADLEVMITTVRPSSAERGIPGPMVYLGKERSEYLWEASRNHHKVLINGSICHLSGYDVKYLSSVHEDMV